MSKIVFNKTSLSTPGDALRAHASHGIIHRTYPEGYFMQKSPLAKDYVAPDKTNFALKLIRKMVETYKEIVKATKPEEMDKMPEEIDFITKIRLKEL